MKITLKNNIIWAQTPTASAKLVTFKSRRNALHAIKWCGKFQDGENAGKALIEHCNKVGLKPHGSPISTSFGGLAGKKASFLVN